MEESVQHWCHAVVCAGGEGGGGDGGGDGGGGESGGLGVLQAAVHAA